MTGLSLPVYWNMDRGVPMIGVRIETDIVMYPDLELDYFSYSDLNLNLGRVADFVRVMSDSIPLVSERESSMDVHLQSRFDPFFSLSSTSLKINLVNIISVAPSLTVIVSQSLPTSI